jgi:hypothetical protein
VAIWVIIFMDVAFGPNVSLSFELVSHFTVELKTNLLICMGFGDVLPRLI